MGARGTSSSTVSTLVVDNTLDTSNEVALKVAQEDLQFDRIILDEDEAMIDVYEQIEEYAQPDGLISMDVILDNPIKPRNLEVYSQFVNTDNIKYAYFDYDNFITTALDTSWSNHHTGTLYDVIEKDDKLYIKKNSKLSPRKWFKG